MQYAVFGDAFFHLTNVFEFHPCCSRHHHSLLTAELFSIVLLYHILFVYSSIDGHLGCLYILAIKNNAAIRIHV